MNDVENTAMLDCLLVCPNYKLNKGSVYRSQRFNDPPLGLMALASYVREKGHSVKIVDCNVEARGVENFTNHLKKNYVDKNISIRVFGFTTTTLTISTAFLMAKVCKVLYPESTVVFGGTHSTLMSEESINNENVDIVAKGEGELTLEEILAGKEWSEIDGIVYKNNLEKDKIVSAKPRERIKNIDILPFPAYDLIEISRYRPVTGAYKRLPAMLMVSSRGCPWSCIFCKGAFEQRATFRSAERIYEEVLHLVNNCGIKEILFMDDVFTVKKKNLAKLCDLLIENKIDITWVCFARVDVIDLELLQKMKDAGCHQIMYGVENFDPEVLKTINKKISKDLVFQAVRWTKEIGIDVRLSFLVGNPGDTEEIILENIRLIRELDPAILVVCIVMPFPGTALYTWAKSNDRIITYDWDEYYGANPVMRIDHLSTRDINRLYAKMIRSFYFRPHYILRKILKSHTWTEIGMLAIGFTGLVAFSIERAKRNAKGYTFAKLVSQFW
ncbi:MAG TPA: radical SAM protein [Flavobacteriales bacterium]|nr:radical SAM protein [Flavobacteriales bacterium]